MLRNWILKKNKNKKRTEDNFVLFWPTIMKNNLVSVLYVPGKWISKPETARPASKRIIGKLFSRRSLWISQWWKNTTTKKKNENLSLKILLGTKVSINKNWPNWFAIVTSVAEHHSSSHWFFWFLAINFYYLLVPKTLFWHFAFACHHFYFLIDFLPYLYPLGNF